MSNLTLIVRDTEDPQATASVETVNVEVVADLILGAKETCTVSITPFYLLNTGFTSSDPILNTCDRPGDLFRHINILRVSFPPPDPRTCLKSWSSPPRHCNSATDKSIRAGCLPQGGDRGRRPTAGCNIRGRRSACAIPRRMQRIAIVVVKRRNRAYRGGVVGIWSRGRVLFCNR